MNKISNNYIGDYLDNHNYHIGTVSTIPDYIHFPIPVVEEEKKELEKILRDNGFEIEGESYLREDESFETLSGWILLKFIQFKSSCSNSNFSPRFKVFTIKEVGENPEVKIKLIESETFSQIFICPESIGTMWELEEAREEIIRIFDEYITVAENLRSPRVATKREDSIFPDLEIEEIDTIRENIGIGTNQDKLSNWLFSNPYCSTGADLPLKTSLSLSPYCTQTSATTKLG